MRVWLMNCWKISVFSWSWVCKSPAIAKTKVSHVLFNDFCRLPRFKMQWCIWFVLGWIDNCIKVSSDYDNWLRKVGYWREEVMKKLGVICVWSIYIRDGQYFIIKGYVDDNISPFWVTYSWMINNCCRMQSILVLIVCLLIFYVLIPKGGFLVISIYLPWVFKMV